MKGKNLPRENWWLRYSVDLKNRCQKILVTERNCKAVWA